MSPVGGSGAWPRTLVVLLLLATVGGWPLVDVGSQATPRIWALSGAAVLLGMLLAFWLQAHRMRLPRLRAASWGPWLWAAAAVFPAAAIASTPAGVRMIYSGALEGIVVRVALIAIRTRLMSERVPRDEDRPG